MDIDANDLLLFARIVEAGSFSRAAQRAGLPKSTLSRRLSQLEARLGERLLLRTTRRLVLTEFGTGLLEHARQVDTEVEAATAFAQNRQASPSGRLRISAPGDFANLILTHLIAQFVARYPAIRLEIDLSPRRVDLLGENFDLAIRVGDLPDDATLAARRIATFSTGLYAAPAYTALRGLPDDPEALMRHDALCLLGRDGMPNPWSLTRGKARWEGLPPSRIAVNAPEMLIRLACIGAGITAVSDFFAMAALRRGELIRLLPEWSLPEFSAWAVFPGRRLMPAKTRVFLDMLEEAFTADRCADVRKQLHTR